MDQLAPAARLIRFGVFELDLRTGELRKSGLKLRLHGQPVEVLKLLLERPGELVTREELEKRLWVGDTVVEFEHSINAAVNRLREALGDSADNPRFIETLARRGYRFIYPVEGASPPAAAPGAAMPSSPVGSEDATAAPPAEPVAPVSPPFLQRGRLWLAMAAGFAAFVLVGLAYLLTRPLPPPRVLRTTQITNDGKPKFFGPFSGSGPILTDGSRLYFTEYAGGRYVVAEVSVSGGVTALISSSLPNALPLDISPSGSELLVLSLAMYTETESALWVVPTLAGSPRRLGNGKSVV